MNQKHLLHIFWLGMAFWLLACQNPDKPCETSTVFLRMLTPLNDQKIELNWSLTCDAEYYEIIRDDSVVATAETSPWIDSTCAFGEEYTYAILTHFSDTPLDTSNMLTSRTLFPAPSELRATLLSEGVLQLDWFDNCNFENAYTLMRDGEVVAEVPANTTTYIDSGLAVNEYIIYSLYAKTVQSVSTPDSLLLMQRSYIDFAEISEITNDVDPDIDDIQLADIDGDGLEDLISVSLENHRLAWYANFGDGNFGPEEVVVSDYYTDKIVVEDFDGDGLNDLFAFTNEGFVQWYRNLGAGVFEPQEPFDTLLALGMPYERIHPFAIDMNHDGATDILIARSANHTFWYQNSGSGVFGDSTNMWGLSPSEIHQPDLDGDGDNDLLMYFSQYNDVAWIENSGGTYNWDINSNEINWHYIDDVDFYTIIPADLDADGDIDIIGSPEYGHGTKFRCLINSGDGSFGSETILFSAPSQGGYGLSAGDLDLDGDLDLIVQAGYQVSLYSVENMGEIEFAQPHYLGSSTNWSANPHLMDINQDGLLDIIASKGKIWWKANQGRQVVLVTWDSWPESIP